MLKGRELSEVEQQQSLHLQRDVTVRNCKHNGKCLRKKKEIYDLTLSVNIFD